MPRSAIHAFELSNPLYKNASVSFFGVAAGVKTSTLATLYAGMSGSSQLANPQKLNSNGQLKQPVYIASQVIGTISGISVPGHDTGIHSPAPLIRFTSAGVLQYSYDAGVTYTDAGTLAVTTVASLVDFLQAGSGAVSRTMQEKGREEVSAEDFGLATTNTPAQNSACIELAMASGAKRIKISTPGEYTFSTAINRTCTNLTPSVVARCAIMPRPNQELIVEGGVTLITATWASVDEALPVTNGPGHLILAIAADKFKLSGHGKILGNWVNGVPQGARDVLSSQHCVYIASSDDVTVSGTLEITGAWTDGITIGYWDEGHAQCHNSRNVRIDAHIYDNQRCNVSGVGWVGGSISGEIINTTGGGTSPFAGIDFEPNNVTGLVDGDAVCRDIRLTNLHTKGNGIGVLSTCAVSDRIGSITIDGSCVIEDGLDLHKMRYSSIAPGVVKRLQDDPTTSAPVDGIRLRASLYNRIAPGMIYDVRKHGISLDIDSNYNEVEPGMIVSCSQETTNTYHAVYCNGSYNTISPKKAHRGVGGALSRRGIEFGADSVSNYTLLSDLTNAGQTGEILDGGSDNIILSVGATQTKLQMKAWLEMEKLLTTNASEASAAGFNVPHGVAPAAPADGDMWTTVAGLYVRINGVTVGPLT